MSEHVLTEDNRQNHRIEWIDIARGITIILVCLGHRDIPTGLTKWIYTFHMPAFFFISGYVTKYDGISFGAFMKKKLKGLVIPYLSLGAVYILLEFLYAMAFHKDFQIVSMLTNLLKGHSIGSGWFIVALLVVELLSFALHHLDWKIRLPIVILIVAGGFVLNSYIDNQLIWDIPAAMIGIFFFEFGSLVMKYSIIQKISGRLHNIYIYCA